MASLPDTLLDLADELEQELVQLRQAYEDLEDELAEAHKRIDSLEDELSYANNSLCDYEGHVCEPCEEPHCSGECGG